MQSINMKERKRRVERGAVGRKSKRRLLGDRVVSTKRLGCSQFQIETFGN